uniref:Uncharacterized protein n=1 Tax=Anopheles culicifacies TaxID=139723 RepID=A0A182MEZ8_9DIPT
MMARSSCSAGLGSMMQLLLVRFLLMAVVLVAVLDAEVAAGSVRTVTRQTSASVAEDEDSSSAAVGSSDEMLEDESFEQDASRRSGEKQDSWHESESTTEPNWTEREDTVEAVTGTTLGYSAVATTPKIVPGPVKQLSR